MQTIKSSKSSNFLNNLKGSGPEISGIETASFRHKHLEKKMNESNSFTKNGHHSEYISQKDSGVHQNSSHPAMDPLQMKRKYKPIEHKLHLDKRNLQIPNSNSFLTHYLSPKGNQPKK